MSSDEEALLEEGLHREIRDNEIFIDLNPESQDSEDILKRHPKSELLKKIQREYGFVSPPLIIIEAYVEFFMVRYLRLEEHHNESEVRAGLWAEKAFDILLQHMRVYHNYPEPTRDWRRLQPVDFYIPCIGSIEAKSVTLFPNWKTDTTDHNINIPIRDFNKNPDYFLALEQIPTTEYILMVGMMKTTDLKTLCADSHGGWKKQYYRDTRQVEKLKSPFLCIPAERFEKGEKSISARRVVKALSNSKRAVAELSETKHINP